MSKWCGVFPLELRANKILTSDTTLALNKMAENPGLEQNSYLISLFTCANFQLLFHVDASEGINPKTRLR